MNILLVDDHELVRFGLSGLLGEVAGGQAMVHEAGTLSGALALYGDLGRAVDLVIMDLNLPDARGLSGLRRFVRAYPDATVVVLSGSLDDAIVGEAIAIGAKAYLHKTSDVAALRVQLAEMLLLVRGPTIPAPAQAPSACRTNLNARELKILDMVLQGLNNKEIAEAMGIAHGTAKNHMSGLFAAFGVNSRSRLMALFQ